jgi:hypothetical protein
MGIVAKVGNFISIRHVLVITLCHLGGIWKVDSTVCASKEAMLGDQLLGDYY